MQTHHNLYQHNTQRLEQLRQEAAANALARQTSQKPSWLMRLQQVFVPRPCASAKASYSCRPSSPSPAGPFGHPAQR